MNVMEIFETMEYGPAPEAATPGLGLDSSSTNPLACLSITSGSNLPVVSISIASIPRQANH